MKVTDVIEKSAEMTRGILNSMMEEDLANCGCSRCVELLKVIEQKRY